MPIVYVLTNKSMPNVVKIGITNKSLEQRMRELDKTNVALPFECYYAVQVDDTQGQTLEQKVHQGLDAFRVRSNREFFSISSENAKSILEIAELMGGKNVTPANPDEALQAAEVPEAEEPQRKMKMGPRFTFSMLGVPLGAILTFKKNHSITCEVLDDTHVMFRGKKMALTRSAKIVLREMGFNWPTVRAIQWWCWNGEALLKLRTQANS